MKPEPSTITKCIEDTGRVLNVNNQDILKYLCSLEEERNNLGIIIDKQYEERKKIEAEIEKLTYKLCLVNKSLSMRIRAKNNYDKNVDEIRSHYDKLVEGSSKLKQMVEKTHEELDDLMNKKIGTDEEGSDSGSKQELRTLYARQGVTPSTVRPEDECDCEAHGQEAPTKDLNPVTNGKAGVKPAPIRQPSQPLAWLEEGEKISQLSSIMKNSCKQVKMTEDATEACPEVSGSSSTMDLQTKYLETKPNPLLARLRLSDTPIYPKEREDISMIEHDENGIARKSVSSKGSNEEEGQ